jgi:YHS domain-containing protein/mono/diheme cytochrome c family protein
MLWKNAFYLVLISLMTVLLIGCSGTSEKDASQFSEMALQGKKVFESKNCGECHSVGEPRADAQAPDLSNAFIANDSMFVQAHLKFVDNTKMPPIRLTDKDITLLSHYIAELHRAAHPTIPEEEADTHCPVCYAPVSIEKATTEKLFVSYLGEKYYFECHDCMEAFEKAPEAFIVLWRTYEAEKVKAVME